MAKFTPTIKELRLREKTIIDNPETMDTICTYVADGGTLIDLCELWDVRFGAIMNWVFADKERSLRYRNANNSRGEWAVQMVLRELRALGFSDIRDLFDEKGKLKPMKEWPNDAAKAVIGIEVSSDGDDTKTKIKQADKLKALELIGKNLAMFTDKLIAVETTKLEDIVMGSYRNVTPKEGSNGAKEIGATKETTAAATTKEVMETETD